MIYIQNKLKEKNKDDLCIEKKENITVNDKMFLSALTMAVQVMHDGDQADEMA